MARARVDFESKTMVVGIRELVEPARDSARGIGMLPLLRAELGRAVHERYREQREQAFAHEEGEGGGDGAAAFQAEVGVEIQREVCGFRARVRGRADGVVRAPKRGPEPGPEPGVVITVEEVKSMVLGAAEIHDLTLDAVSDHALQARLYALCLARQEPAAEIRARLLLVSIVDDYQRTVDLDFSVEGAERALDRLLRRALAEAEEARALRQRRTASARFVVFPYPRMRPLQDRLIADMGAGLEAERPVLASAPTGIGKTVSALMAGLAHALESGASLYFATAKTTQQALVARTFEDMVRASPGLAAGEVAAMTMRAKERMCPPGDLACHPEMCSYLADFSARASECDALGALVRGGEHVTPERIFEYGQAQHLCPFELSLKVAARAELVIADYNYVYDPGVALAPFSDLARRRSAAVVVDEGHNLLDRARGYHSVFIARAAIDTVRARLASGAYLGDAATRRREQTLAQLALTVTARPSLGTAADRADGTGAGFVGPRLLAEIDALCVEVDALIERITTTRLGPDGRARTGSSVGRGLVMDGCATVERDASTWNELAERAMRALLGFALHARARRLVVFRDPLPELLREIVRMRDAMLGDEPEIVPYVAGVRAPDGAGLGVLCVDPGPRLAERHGRVLGTVVMSATLSPLSYYADVLGFSAMEPLLGRVDSPFPVGNREVVIVPTVHTSYRRRSAHVADIAGLVADIIGARPGRYIAFFSSFSFLGQVARALSAPGYQVLCQARSMDQEERVRTLSRLCESPGPALLLAVSGGVFAEGVDLPGDRLIGAIVVGPSLPSVGFERTLMRAYHDQRGRNGFAYAMLFPGMQRVIQSAGRVIRTMEDRGVIALLGQRFTERRYAELLPREWYGRDIRELITMDPGPRLARFWARLDQAAPRAGRAPYQPADRPPDPRTRDRGLR